MADIKAMATLFYRSVREGARTYSRAQREAWAPTIPNVQQWVVRLADQRVVIAEDEAGMAGFMTMDKNGYIDLAPKALFERHGWTLDESIQVERQGVALPCHLMHKRVQ